MLIAAVYNTKTIIRPVLMFGSETWALRKAEHNLQERTEMRKNRDENDEMDDENKEH